MLKNIFIARAVRGSVEHVFGTRGSHIRGVLFQMAHERFAAHPTADPTEPKDSATADGRWARAEATGWRCHAGGEGVAGPLKN
jgi:hypothetical protein